MLPLSELCRSITMKLPDPLWALSEHERYRAGCSTHDFARWTDEEGREHYYLFGALDIPLAHTEEDVFNWGLWVEVEKAFHDAYYDAYQTPAADDLAAEGFVANEVPGYEDALGARVRIVCHADRRPEVTPLEGTLLADQTSGLTEARHRELDELLFGDDEEEEGADDAELFDEDDER